MSAREHSSLAAASLPPTAAPSVDLSAYCARIGYDGPLQPTIEVLRALQAQHPARIPFEAIDVLLDTPIDLAPEAVDEKLIHRQRGGYCFEHNNLFKRVLETIGFEVEGLIARVNWNAAPGAPLAPPTHMALKVFAGGRAWLVDTGFGSCVPTAPLAWDSREAQETGHESFRLVEQGADLQLEALIAGEWAPVYRILPSIQLDSDYAVPNWYTSTSPTSHFRHRLIVTRTTPEARQILVANRLTVRRPDGTVEHRLLSAAEIARELTGRFGLPVIEKWGPLIAQAAIAEPSG